MSGSRKFELSHRVRPICKAELVSGSLFYLWHFKQLPQGPARVTAMATMHHGYFLRASGVIAIVLCELSPHRCRHN